jgi:DNA polymerase-3 subunit epsilon
MSAFVALDFETANRYRDSACAIGLVRVENNQIVEKVSYLIRPPQRQFEFIS